MRKLFFIFVTVIGFLQIPMQSINAQSMKKEEVPQNISAFPLGKENTGFKQYFTGESWLAPLTGNKDLNVPMSNVTFEPGCRNNWHSHTGGQILIAVGGVGYYQERGKAARRLLPGDVVEIAPDIEHWHGAAPDSWFSHLAIGCNPQTNKNIWLERVDDQQYAEATKDNGGTGLSATDPELDAIFGNFTKEVQQYGNLDTKTRLMVTLASNIASQAQTEYRMMLESALNAGITPIEIKEILYQAVAYAGMAKVMDFVGITNEVLLAHGVHLPLEGQAVVSAETRFDKGLALQKSIFGERIDQMHKNAPENQKHIQRYLSANCFGDYQTRGGLDVKTRELLTFSILVSLGGCESQVKGHIQGNVNVGNNKDTLLAVVTQLLPYIGYPRTLNAIACLNEVIPEK
ncbi:cupin domain-containing carboxymuconolactone decarboxylase family protein [Bacteroides thetaiotaomicron]|jgi:4-carboxymuconolactone decarboxylase|uniref:4-carboxymuconolactone decarboxylase n=1 Tax=Bacteroides thetaiotaomicron TaxID=818 RepID=A0A139K0M0_BACT4|nr:carboxymuconolactone decarboxylase family protein [Bacteroides thetaiotaomicron]KXT32614.1 carboxymuconolactone decarboxylase family protein [Bacteroides thetaiotaomicron]MBL3928071.1 4-carboxymuconolactone decarboxylase [Bacteroides thetaiotaomicron]MBL3952402.1 4-carboxymuconolactone decarboxylase [Bacteroides thetaiotaomicron]MCA6010786.1 carboxymuconolactone decarboxylase family protein [Bacteroides thetaiotaomicron]MCE8813872.1 carboxymuconolactone decarboxylase family protein [Bactero